MMAANKASVHTGTEYSYTMHLPIKKHFESVFELLVKNKGLILPDKETINVWDNVLNEWVDDNQMTLFVRKSGIDRGSKINVEYTDRHIITTDNAPAHWVFKSVVFDKQMHTKEDIKRLLMENTIPICFIGTKKERLVLPKGAFVDRATKMNERGYKLAHIHKIAIRRGSFMNVVDYKKHHFRFLSLSNMYLINNNYSGLAEVETFNRIIMSHMDRHYIPAPGR